MWPSMAAEPRGRSVTDMVCRHESYARPGRVPRTRRSPQIHLTEEVRGHQLRSKPQWTATRPPRAHPAPTTALTRNLGSWSTLIGAPNLMIKRTGDGAGYGEGPKDRPDQDLR